MAQDLVIDDEKNILENSEIQVNEPATLGVSFEELFNKFIEAYGKTDSDVEKEKFAALLSRRLRQEMVTHTLPKDYNLLILFDNTTLVKSDSDAIYTAIKLLPKNKPLLLVLLSRGGEPGSAYLIGKLCQESARNKFVVVIPRYAKSAATLLATAADEIHMGSLSELGPIDPQIDKMPALGLKNSIEHIAELVTKFPESSRMFANYLSTTVEPIQIGYYERVAESEVQYAERLLESHKGSLVGQPADIANKLVYGYKDHGFVIDKEEAQNIFGTKTVKSDSPEYAFGNGIYNILSQVEELADFLEYSFYFIGSLDSKPQIIRRKKKRV